MQPDRLPATLQRGSRPGAASPSRRASRPAGMARSGGRMRTSRRMVVVLSAVALAVSAAAPVNAITRTDTSPGTYVAASSITPPVVRDATLFDVYDKQGNLQLGPVELNTLWQDFGVGSGDPVTPVCGVSNAGDPIVQYDQLADRWLLSQFAFSGGAAGVPTGPYYECVAISSTA